MGHTFTFFRAGGSSYQASLDRGADIGALAELDQKLWVALACPTSGLELDGKTLVLVDTDHDGRIRPPEILAAVTWMDRVLVNLDELPERTAELALDHIDTSNDEGRELLASAKVILKNLGKKGEETISLDDVLDTTRIFAETKFNGDGVVPADSADDDFVRGVVLDVIACLGAETDRSGKPGVSRPKLDAFFEQATALAKWFREQTDSKEIPAAFDAFAAVEAKLEDYFVRARLAQFDPRAAGPLNRSEADWTAVSTGELSTSSATVGAFPLARVEPGRPLPLDGGLNPAWIDAMRAFERDTVTPLLGKRPSLTDADFAAIRAKLADHRAHLAARPATSLASLSRERVEAIASSEARAKIAALIDEDEAVRPQVEAIARVEKLLRYKRDLHRLLCNFVNFRDFYLSGEAVFQAGTLYLDERSCDLCVRVDAAGSHADIAGASNTFLVYCDCTRRGAGDAPEKMTIAAALTAGDESRVHVGRNGIFYDRAGHDWDARVVKVVKQPISIREAFWLPYRRIGTFIGEQIEKFAGERDKEVETTGKDHVTGVAQSAVEDAPEKPFDVARFAGILAAVGLAIGAIGSALAVVLTSFFGLAWWQMPLALAGVMLAISGPSMLIAYLKLRGRMLGPILDGAGWAVNAEARINIAFGTSLTERGALPSDAQRIRRDLYPDKKSGVVVWATAILVAASAVAWKLGYLKPWLAYLLRAVKKS